MPPPRRVDSSSTWPLRGTTLPRKKVIWERDWEKSRKKAVLPPPEQQRWRQVSLNRTKRVVLSAVRMDILTRRRPSRPLTLAMLYQARGASIYTFRTCCRSLAPASAGSSWRWHRGLLGAGFGRPRRSSAALLAGLLTIQPHYPG